MTSATLQESIRRQRDALTELLREPMHALAARCAAAFGNRPALEELLLQTLPAMAHCKHLYVLDADGVQVVDNITREGRDPGHYRRDRSSRPYMEGVGGGTDFKLSEAYISRNKKRPSLTAVQVIRDTRGEPIGFLGADYDLRELPHTGALYREPDGWRQIKGDPAIREGVFLQRRVPSVMDQHLDEVLALMNELMTQQGVFHGKFHFSSNRATVWLVDDPFAYRILGIDELIDPNICLAYPRRPYTSRAIVPADRIMPVFELFRRLRLADETIYLRSGSLNLCNGMVALNFSCDGTHYMRFDEFLSKDADFWL